MKDTSRIGDTSNAQILAALVKTGRNVLIPFNEGQKYDLVVEDGGEFKRLQSKTAWMKRGGVHFHTHRPSNGEKYGNDIDLFGVYCFEIDSVFLVPKKVIGDRYDFSLWIEHLTGKTDEQIRLDLGIFG
jgi:hypothetical protein